jgi:DNA processing protein
MELTVTQKEWLSLVMVPGVGTTKFVRLLARFNSPGEVLAASEAALSDVVGEKLAQRIRQYGDIVDIDRQIEMMNRYGVTLITMDDPRYPPHLAEIYDPPLTLFARGELHEGDHVAVAIVGTRKASPYGLKMAEKFGRELAARGITVISGLAEGVDAAAHRGALEAGGRTLAVLASGVDIVYPSQNADLMHNMIQRAAVLSPFPMGTKPSRGLFPYRNRMISGLSLGTVVIEAPPGSGALITARFAADQGREVFALPGQVGQANSRGPHSLIREGAKLVETTEDILVELDIPSAVRVDPPENTGEKPSAAGATQDTPTPSRRPEPAVSEVEKDVLSSLGPDGSFVDEIALACRISVSEALSSLTMLELKGLVQQFSGKRFAIR